MWTQVAHVLGSFWMFAWGIAFTSAHKTAKKRQIWSNIKAGQVNQWDRGMGREVTSLTAKVQPWLRCLGGDLLCTWPDAQTTTPGHVSEIFLSLLHVLVDLIQALFYAVQLFCPCGGDRGGHGWQQEGQLKGVEICEHAHTNTYRVHIWLYICCKGLVNNKRWRTHCPHILHMLSLAYI